MNIIAARKSDAPAIGSAIIEAVGEDICLGLAAPDHTLDDVRTLFTRLALLDDSQYSYRNALVALDDSGEVMGVCVAYDGAGLYDMRELFFSYVREMLGKEMTGIDDETDASEFYIDTLAVKPRYRGQGVASALLRAMIERARAMGKPAGLLVDKDNSRARRLYEKIGFGFVGERPFCYVMMDHLQCV